MVLRDEPAERVVTAKELAAILPMGAAERVPELGWLKWILGGFEFILIPDPPEPSPRVLRA